MNVNLIAIDLAKNVFQVCGVNREGKQVFNRAVRRAKLPELIAQHSGTVIAMEACGGSNYWGRRFEQDGHEVRLIPPIQVKPFVKGNKNDRNDAFAISEAARRPNVSIVPPRSVEQTDLILAHRIRDRRVKSRTALINQARGLLGEYGIVVAPGPAALRAALPLLLEDAGNALTPMARQYLHSVLEEWRALEQHIDDIDQAIKVTARSLPAVRRLLDIQGVGCMIATAMVAKLGRGLQFHSGRQFSASLGLVPCEHSSGGKQRLGGISRRGDHYLRRLLIQGAWSVIRYADTREDRLSRWARELVQRRGKHKAVIAVANKLARIIWAMVRYERDYQAM
jgi:transposase